MNRLNINGFVSGFMEKMAQPPEGPGVPEIITREGYSTDPNKPLNPQLPTNLQRPEQPEQPSFWSDPKGYIKNEANSYIENELPGKIQGVLEQTLNDPNTTNKFQDWAGKQMPNLMKQLPDQMSNVLEDKKIQGKFESFITDRINNIMSGEGFGKMMSGLTQKAMPYALGLGGIAAAPGLISNLFSGGGQQMPQMGFRQGGRQGYGFRQPSYFEYGGNY